MSQDDAPRGPSIRRVPAGDTHERLICPDCGYVQYDNPKIVVGVVCAHQDRVLLCRRAIDPRKGFWVFPAGYLELNETTLAGAVREAREEAGVAVEIDALLAVYAVARISQVQLIYRGRLASPRLAPGPETIEARLFAWHDVPWADLAFPTVHWALRHHRQSAGRGGFAPWTNPEGESADYLPASSSSASPPPASGGAA